MITLKRHVTEIEAKMAIVVANLEKAQTELAESMTKNETLVKENEVLNIRIKELTENPANVEKLEEVSTQLTEVVAENAELEQNIETLTDKVVKLEAKDNDFEAAVADKAIEITSAQGVPPLSTKPVVQPAALTFDGDIVAKYNSITNPLEQRLFWENNREAFVAILKGKGNQ